MNSNVFAQVLASEGMVEASWSEELPLEDCAASPWSFCGVAEQLFHASSHQAQTPCTAHSDQSRENELANVAHDYLKGRSLCQHLIYVCMLRKCNHKQYHMHTFYSKF